MNTGKAFLGILGGVAVGATIGVLIAPEKGAYTRMKISRKGRKYSDEVVGKFNDAIEIITKKFEALRKEITHLAENGKAKANYDKAEVIAAMK